MGTAGYLRGYPANYAGKLMWVKNQRNSWHDVDYPYHRGEHPTEAGSPETGFAARHARRRLQDGRWLSFRPRPPFGYEVDEDGLRHAKK